MKKRLVSMILAGAMVLGLAACGSGGADDTKAETGAETGAATEAVTEAEGTEGGAETPAAAGTEGKKAKEDLVIGVSWKTFQEERWVRELEIMQKVCDEQGIKMIYQVSEYDAMKQANQIENLVSQGIDILIVTSNEKETVSNAMKAAADAGVFVCYYEATSGECYAQFSGGNEEYAIGRQITEAVADMGLSGKVAFVYGDPAGGTGIQKFHDGMHDTLEEKNCDIEIVGEQWATNWDPSIAMSNTENWIATYGDELAAVLCMNDGLAGGAIQALTDAGMEGKVLVTGMDCDLVALQRIAAGTQVSTILKSGNEYPEQFMNTCIDYYIGDLTMDDFEYKETNSEGEEIPFFNYPGKVITKDNIDDVIDAGVYTREEIYGE